MSKIRHVVITVLAAGVLIAALPGCEKKEGPGERAGKAVDQAVQDTGKKIEQAGEKIQDAAKDAKK
jgi:predicted small secreted protein